MEQLSQEGLSVWTPVTSLLVVAFVLAVLVGGSRRATSAHVTTVVLAFEGVVAGVFAFLSPVLLADGLAFLGVSTVTTINTLGMSRTYLIAAAWFAVVVYRLARSGEALKQLSRKAPSAPFAAARRPERGFARTADLGPRALERN